MRRLSRTVITLAVVGAVAGTVTGPTSALAAPAGVDVSAHAYSFDHTLADSAGGVGASSHGSVVFAAGRLDPPDTNDGSLRFDGRPGDYVSIATPVLAYGTTDFTLDLWLSTTARTWETILDTRACAAHGGGFALVMSGAGRLAVRGAAGGDDESDDATRDRATRDGATGHGATGHGATGHGATGEDSAGRGTTGGADRPGAGVRANDGHWHEVTLTRTGSTIVVRLDGTVDQTVTLASLADLDGAVGVRLGRGWCDNARGFEGELDDLTVTPAPAAALPETPLVALLPVSAAAVGALALSRRRRRRRPAHRPRR